MIVRNVGEARRDVGHDRGVDNAEALGSIDAAQHVDDGPVLRPRTHRARADDVRDRVFLGTDQLVEVVRLGRRRAAAEPTHLRSVGHFECSPISVGKPLRVRRVAQLRELDDRPVGGIGGTKPHGARGARSSQHDLDREARVFLRIGEPKHQIGCLARRRPALWKVAIEWRTGAPRHAPV